MNFHRSGISKLHVGINGVSIGEYPLVSQAVKTVFRLRFPLPKYQSTFDIVPVLAYVLSLHTASISLQLLLFKASFLTVIPLFFREAAQITLDRLSWSREIVWSCILSPWRNRRELGM